MNDFDTVDFFTDEHLANDPYPYFEHVRAQCPVVREPAQGTLKDNEDFEFTEVT